MTDLPESTPKKTRKRSWPRRIFRIILILVVVGVIVRLALPFVLPIVVDQVAASLDLKAEYEDLSLSILGGEVELRGLVITPAEGGDEIASLNYARVDIRMWKLLSGGIHVSRVEVDGIDLHLVRKADGTIPLLDRFRPVPGGAEDVEDPEPESEPEDTGPTEVDYSLPLRVDDLLAIDVRLHVSDEAVEPALDTTAHLAVVLSNLGDPKEDASYSALLRVDDILGSLRLNGTVGQPERSLHVRTQLEISSLEAVRLASYLLPMGIDVRVEDTDLRFEAGLELGPDPEDVNRGIARIELKDLRARSDGVTGVRLGHAGVEIRGLGTNMTELADATVSDVAASLLLDENGDPVVIGIALVPPPRDETPEEPEKEPDAAPEPEEAPEDAPGPEPAPEAEPEPAHIFRIANAAVDNVRVTFRDETDGEPVETEIIVEHLVAEDLTTETDTTGGRLETRISAPGVIESLELSGLASPFVQPLFADLNFAIEGVTPAPIRGWLDRIGITLPFDRGELHMRLVARADLFSTPDVLGTEVELTDVEFEADDRSHKVAESVTVTGGLKFPDDRVEMEFVVDGRGLDMTGTSPWLVGTGMEPLLTNARLGLRFDMQIDPLDDGTLMHMGLANASLRQGDEEPFRCDQLNVIGMVVDSAGTRIEKITGSAPSLQISWDHRQTRLLGVGFSAPEPDPEAKEDEPEEKEERRDDEEPEDPDDDGPCGFGIGEIALTDGDLVLRNEDREDAIDVRFLLDVGSDGVSIRGEKTRAGFEVGVRAPETGAHTSVKGLLTKDGDLLHTEFALAGDEIGGDRLSKILPRGMTFSLEAGEFAANVVANLDTSVDGVRKIDVAVTGVDLHEGEETTPVFGFRELKVAAEIHEETEDLPLHIDVDEVLMTGLEGELRLAPDDSLRFLGLTFSPVPPLPGTGEEEKKITVEERFQAILKSRKDPPRLQIRKLRVGVDRITMIDEKPGTQPLVMRDIVLENPKPIDTASRETGDEDAPLNLALTAKSSRFVKAIEVSATARPFARPPSAEIDVLFDGINGEEFMKALPDLANTVDLSEIESGRFEAHAELKLNHRGKTPTDFDITRGFGIQITGVRFEDVGRKQTFLTVEEIAASVTRLLPGRIDVSSVEILSPRASVTIEDEGYRLLGVLVKKPETPPETEAPAPTGPAVASEAAEDPPAKAPEDGLKQRSGGLSVGNFYVSDLSLDFRDESLRKMEGEKEVRLQPVHLPFIGTEIEVRGFRTKMEANDKVRFQIVARSDKISLPDSDREKPAFDEITLVGQLGLEPQTTGWIRTSVIGLELTNFKGLARKNDVTLDGGTLELGLGARFRNDGGMNLNSSIAFRDLSLSERENGFLFKLLKLPASTDTVIFLLRDHAGTISFSFGLDVPPDGVSTGRIASLAITKVSELIALAVLKSPLRVGAGIAGIVGIGTGREEPEEPIVLEFRPGSTRLTREHRGDFAELIERMGRERDLVVTLEHELGRGDIPPVDARFNPRAEDCRAIAGHLRLRQRQLIAERARIVERARVSLGLGQAEEAAEVRDQLETIDRSIGIVSRELDQVLAILRHGAERLRSRRTRDGCISLGRMRIEELASRLIDGGIALDRIRYRRPRFAEPELESGGIVTIQPGRRIDTEQPKSTESPPDEAPAKE